MIMMKISITNLFIELSSDGAVVTFGKPIKRWGKDNLIKLEYHINNKN